MRPAPILPFVPELPEGYLTGPDGGILCPDGRPARVLLHCCCAPCSSAVLEWLVSAGVRPCVFFSNSNIVPKEEYDHRRAVLEEYAASFGLETVDDAYDHPAWLDSVCAEAGRPRELALMRERGPRCLACFRFRLSRAAAYARAEGYDLLTTTLASSRWKDIRQVDEAGRSVCGTEGPVWWGQNWRKGGLQERRNCIIRESGMYNQPYCGCEFSINKEETGSR